MTPRMHACSVSASFACAKVEWWRLRLDSDVPPRHGVRRVRLNAHKAWRPTTLAVGVVKGRGLLAQAILGVGQKHAVVIPLHRDLVLEPDAGDQRGAWNVLLRGRLVHVEMPDAVTCRDLVDRASA